MAIFYRSPPFPRPIILGIQPLVFGDVKPPYKEGRLFGAAIYCHKKEFAKDGPRLWFALMIGYIPDITKPADVYIYTYIIHINSPKFCEHIPLMYDIAKPYTVQYWFWNFLAGFKQHKLQSGFDLVGFSKAWPPLRKECVDWQAKLPLSFPIRRFV